MCRKLLIFICFVVPFAMCSSTWAGEYIWDGEGGDHLWNTGANWDRDAAPGSDDSAFIDTGDVNSLVIDCNVIVDGETSVGELHGPSDNSNGYSVLDINDVTFTINGPWDWCNNGSGTGVINIGGNSIVTVEGDTEDEEVWALMGIAGSGTTSIFNLSGNAKFICNDYMRQVDDANATAIYNVSGNAVWKINATTPSDDWSMRMADHGTAIFNLRDNALIDLKGYFRGGDNTDAMFIVNMYGGMMRFGDNAGQAQDESIVIGDDGSAEFNFYGGVMTGPLRINIRNRADDSNTVFLIDGGTGYFGGDILLNSGGGDGATVHMLVKSGAMVCDGVLRLPDDGDGNADITMYGGTVAAGKGMEHENDEWFIKMYGGALYLGGNNVNDVNSGIDANFITFPDPTKTAHLEYIGDEDLTILGVYEPTQAWGFRPYDGQINIESGVIKWFSGNSTQDVNGHDVYVGFDKQAVADANRNTAGIYRGSQDKIDTDYNIGLLSPSSTVYWRIDEVNGVDVYKGPVLVFKTLTGEAHDPIPRDGDYTADITQKGTLRWSKGGAWVESSEVYFGTDEKAVEDANTSTVGIYQGSTDKSEYDVGPLVLDGPIYYWRVDQRGGAFYVKGEVWEFKLADYYFWEDFERYTDTPDLYGTWTDYHVDADNGAAAVLSTAYQHSGEQSMELNFDNDWYVYSETARTLDTAEDWTPGDVKALTLYFMGAATNVPDRPYVTLTDTTPTSKQVAYDGDINDLLIEDWTEWNISLSEFQAGGVDITKVKKVAIGFIDNDGYGVINRQERTKR